MRAYILSIGSELLLGHLTDTNATFLAQDLAAHGIDLIHVTHVGDDRDRLVASLRHALDLTDVVVCTGGIGPTDDDVTREAIGDTLEQTPTLDPLLYEQVAAFFAHRGQPMPERNAKQAWLISAAESLPNPVGTAPGWFVRVSGDPFKVIVAMPGVPREMHRMWREQALPRLLPLRGANVIDTETFKTIGIGESAAEQVIHDLVAAASPVVATYAKDDGVHIRVTASGNDAEAVRLQRQRASSVVRDRLGQYIWGEGSETLATALHRLLTGTGNRLALAEVGTGGAFTNLLSGSADIADALLGSTVTPLCAGEAHSAAGFAVEAARTTGATVGMGIVLTSTAVHDGRLDGEVDIAICRAGARPESAPPLKVRAGIPDAQRRAALHAADTLRRWLAAQPE